MVKSNSLLSKGPSKAGGTGVWDFYPFQILSIQPYILILHGLNTTFLFFPLCFLHNTKIFFLLLSHNRQLVKVFCNVDLWLFISITADSSFNCCKSTFGTFCQTDSFTEIRKRDDHARVLNIYQEEPYILTENDDISIAVLKMRCIFLFRNVIHVFCMYTILGV